MEQNSTPPVIDGGSEGAAVVSNHEKSTRFGIALFGFFLFVIFVVGLFWMYTTPELTVGLTLSFVAGLSMIFLPCTLPLAFVIVPLTMGKDPKKGLLMALSFTLGLTITLSFYGVFIAAVGKTFGLKSDAEVYAVLLGGFAAFMFGLSEVGLIHFKLPSYSGNFPGFIQRQKDYMKTFLLGLLLGNAGVGCPNPAFYVLLGYIATTGDLFNGWFLGFVHGMGRSVPLIFLAILGTLGVNALSGVARHKEGIGKVMGWMLLIIGAYLLTFGIFGHDWFIASGIHSSWEQFVVNISGDRFGETVLKHEHKLVDVANFIQYGNMFFLGILALTILAAFMFKQLSRRTKIWLSITYMIIALAIGYSTAWTFKIGASMQHIQFHGQPAAPSDTGGAHTNGHGVYHEERDIREGIAVNFNATPVPMITGTTTHLDFFVNQKPGNTPILASDLELEHTKLIHVIGVRDDMNEFFHIHPIPMLSSSSEGLGINLDDNPNGKLGISYIFQNPGRYKIFSQVKKNGVIHTFGHPVIDVQGEGSRSHKEVSFGRNMITGDYQVGLELDESVAKNIETNFSFDVHTRTGREVEVEPYVGADMHLAVIKDDFTQFIHAHPEEHEMNMDEQHGVLRAINEANAHGGEEEDATSETTDKTINFHIVFPESGLYRLYAQFRPKGTYLAPDESLTASFWVRVSDQPPSFVSLIAKNWWLKVIISLAAIAVLSTGVRKMLIVREQ